MRCIILSWELPPKTIGKLADYVKNLALHLVRNKIETCVITPQHHLNRPYEEIEGIMIHRIKNPIQTHISVLTWVLTLNQEVERIASNIYYDHARQIDLIDVQDWHFIPAAVALKKAFALPFIYSIDSLEDHRSHGANSLLNRSIKSIEWLGMYEAAKVIVKSDWMRHEVKRLYNAPISKISVNPPSSELWINGVLETYNQVVGAEVS